MKLAAKSFTFKKRFITKLATIVFLSLVITLVLVFAFPQNPVFAYSVQDSVPYDKSDYSIASYFENGDTINTGSSAFVIPIQNASLEDYVGSYWSINNSGYVASLTTVNSNTYRILDSDNIYSGEDTVYSVVNIPIPDNLKYLFQLGLVSNVTFTAKAQTQAREIEFAVGVSVGSRHTPTANSSLTGSPSSGTGEIHKTQSTSSYSSYDYIACHMYTFIDGYFWGTIADVLVYDMQLSISVSERPFFRVGLSTPNTSGAAGNRTNLYASVRYNNNIISQDSWTNVYFSTFGDTFSLTATDVDRYPSPVWRYALSGASLHSSYGSAYTASQEISLSLATFVSQSYGGHGMYYGAYYGTPASYTLTLIAPSGFSFNTGLSNWSYSGNSIYRTIYYDNNYSIPMADTLFQETGSFAGWYTGSTLAYGNGGSIQGPNITSDITLTGAFGTYNCLNEVVGDSRYDENETGNRNQTTTGTATFSETQSSIPNTHYVNVIITYNSFSGYNLEGVYAVYETGPLSGVTVTLDRVDVANRRWSLPYCSGDYRIYSSWTVSQNIYNITWSANGGNMPSSYPQNYWQGRGVREDEMPLPTKTGYIFTGWFTASSGGTRYTEIESSHTGSVTLYAHWVNSSINTGSSIYRAPGDFTTNDWYYPSSGGGQVASVTVPTDLQDFVSENRLRATVTVTARARARASGNVASTSYVHANYNGGSWQTIAQSPEAEGNGYSWFTPQWGSWTDSGTVTGTIANNVLLSSNNFTINYRFYNSNDAVIARANFEGWVYSYTISYSVSGFSNNYIYTTTFNRNGASGSNQVLYARGGVSFSIPRAAFWFRPGYRFMGWSTSSSGSIITSFNVTTSSYNRTYYAIWEKDNYIINTWDRYEGETGSTLMVRAPYYQPSDGNLGFLTSAYDNADGIGSSKDPTISNPNSNDGFDVVGWYTDSGGTTAFNPATHSLSQDGSRVSSAIRYLKWHMKNPSISILGHPEVDYGNAINLENYVGSSISTSASNQEYSFTVSFNNPNNFYFTDSAHDYYHNIFEVSHTRTSAGIAVTYTPTVTAYTVVNGVTLTSVATASSAISPTINPIAVSASIQNSQVYYNGTSYNLFDLISLQTVNSQHANVLASEYTSGSITHGSWYDPEDERGLIMSSPSETYEPLYEYYNNSTSPSRFQSNSVRDAGVYTIHSMRLLKDRNINTSYNRNYVWEETENSIPQILDTEDITFTIMPLSMQTVIWFTLKEYGDGDKSITHVNYLPQSSGHEFNDEEQALSDAEAYHKVSATGLLDFDYNPFASDFTGAISRQSGEEVGRYNQSFDLSDINTAVRNNYTISIEGFEFSRAQPFFSADEINSETYVFYDLFEIKEATLSFSWTPEGEGTQFDGQERGYRITVSGLKSQGGLTIYEDSSFQNAIKSVTVADNVFYVTQKNAGEYTATLHINSNNYEFHSSATTKNSWIINPRSLNFSWTDYAGNIYNGNNLGRNVTVSNIVGGETVVFESVTNSIGSTTYEPFDTQQITTSTNVSNTAYGFYAVYAGIYGVAISNPSGNSTYVSNNSPNDQPGVSTQGWYVGTEGGMDDTNYSGYTSSTFQIHRRQLNIIWQDYRTHAQVSTNQSYEFQQDYEQGLTAVVSNILMDDEVQFTGIINSQSNVYTKQDTYSSSTFQIDFTKINVGDYSCLISLLSTDNYVMSASSLGFDIYLNHVTITKWHLKPGSLDGAIEVFNDNNENTTDITVVYSAMTWVMTVAEAIDSKSESLDIGSEITFTYSGNSYTNAGIRNITVTSENENYEVINASNRTWTITPKIVTIDITDWSDTVGDYTYDRTAKGKKVDLISEVYDGSQTAEDTSWHIYLADEGSFRFEYNFVSEKSGNYTRSAQSFTAVNEGDYEVEITGIEGNNYVISQEIGATNSASWTIYKRILSINWPSTSNYTYNKSQYTMTPTINNVIVGDTITPSYSGVRQATNVGNYTVSVSSISGSGSENYTLAANEMNWNILPKQLNATFSTNNQTYDGNPYGVSLTITGMISSDELSINSIYTAKEVGEQNDLLNSGFSPTATILNFDGGSTTRNQDYSAVKAGNYNVTISLDNMPNYSLSGTTSRSWTISQATITVTLSGSGTSVYDGMPHGLEASVSGIIGLETVLFDVTTDTYSLSGFDNITPVANGSYNFTRVNYGYSTLAIASSLYGMGETQSYGAITNYAVSVSGSAGYTINQRQAGIEWVQDEIDTWTGFSTVYNSLTRSVSAQPTNVVSGDVVEFSYSSYQGVNAGDYTTQIDGFQNNPQSNYSLPPSEQRSQQWIIEKRNITASWTLPEFDSYDGTLKDIAYFVVNNIVPAESVTFINTISTSYWSGAQAIASSGITPSSSMTLLADTSGEGGQTFQAIKAGLYDISVELHHNMTNYELIGVTDSYAMEINQSVLYFEWTTSQEGVYLQDSGDYIEYTYGEYDGELHGITVDIGGVKNNESLTLTIIDNFTNKGILSNTTLITDNSSFIFSSKNAGEYSILISEINSASGSAYADKNNYSYNTQSGFYWSDEYTLSEINSVIKPIRCVIQQRQLVASWSEGSFVYSAAQQGKTLTLDNVIGNDTLYLESQVSAFTDSSMTTPITDTGANPFGQNTQNIYGSGGIRTQDFVAAKAGYYLVNGITITNTNYTLTADDGDWTIQKRDLELIWSGSGESVYDGSLHGVSVSISQIQGSDTVTFSITTNYQINGLASQINNGSYDFMSQNAGVYTVSSVSLESSSGSSFSHIENYNLIDNLGASAINTQYIISQRELLAEWSENTFTYNSNAQGETLTVTNMVSSDILYMTATVWAKEIGTDDDLLESGITESGDFTLGSSSSTRNKNFSAYKAGDYTVEVDLNGMDNYTLSGQLVVEWTIERKTITISYSGSSTSQYNGNTQGINATISGIVSDEILLLNVTSSFENNDIVSNVTEVINGVYNFTSLNASSSAYSLVINSITSISQGSQYSHKDNYTLLSEGDNFYTITKRTLTVNWSTASGLVYDKEQKGIQVTIGNIFFSDEITFNISSTGTYPTAETITSSGYSSNLYQMFMAVNADTYTASILSITSHNNGNNNYYLPSNSGVWTIQKRQIALLWQDDTDPVTYNFSFVYDKTQHGITAVADNVIAGDTVSLIITNNLATNVGVYNANVSSIDIGSDNYRLPSSTIKQWSITAKEILVSWSEESLSYDGDPNGVLMYLDGVESGDIIGIIPITSAYALDSGTNLSNSGFYPENSAPLSFESMGGTESYAFGGVRAGDYVSNISMCPDYGAFPNNINYSLSGEIQGEWRIERKTINLEWSLSAENNAEYDGSGYGVDLQISGIVNYERITLIFSSNSYSISDITSGVTLLENGSYEFRSISAGSYSISGVSLGVASSTPQSNQSTTNSVSAANYTLAQSGSNSFTIEKRVLSVDSWDYVEPFTYDKSTKTVVATAGNVVSGDTVVFSYLSDGAYTNSAVNAGSYTALIVGCSPSSNYVIAETDLEKQWQIDSRQLTVVWSEAGSLVYNASAQGISVTIQNIVQTDTITFNITNNGTIPESSTLTSSGSSSTLTSNFRSVNAGVYTASIDSLTSDNKGDNNYSLPLNEGEWTITPKTIGLSWDYEGPYEYYGGNWSVSAEATGIVDDTIITFSYTTDLPTNITTQAVYVDTYFAIVEDMSGEGSQNYQLPDMEYRILEWEITPRQLVFGWNEPSLVYNGESQGNTLTVSNIIAGDEVRLIADLIGTTTSGVGFSLQNIIITTDGSTTYYYDFDYTIDAGSYTVEVGGPQTGYEQSDNYVIVSNYQKIYTIAKKEIVFDWQRDILDSWDNFQTVYNGLQRTVVPAVDNAVAGDSVNLTYSGHTATDVGDYIVSVSAVSNDNYSLPAIVTKEWEIIKRILSLEWYYGEIALATADIRYDATYHTIHAELINQASGDDVSLNYSGNSERDKGEYTAIASLTSSYTNNYAFDLEGISSSEMGWEVSPRIIESVNVDWGAISFEYDNTEKIVEATITNRISGDTIIISYEEDALITNKATNAGEYTAQIESISNENYELGETINTVWHITPKELTVSFSTGSYTYDATLKGITLTISGIVNNDNIIFDVTSTGIVPQYGASQLTYNDSSGQLIQEFSAVAAASYTASVTGIDSYNNGDENYVLPINQGNWTINPATINLSWSLKASNSGIYDGTEQGLNLEIGGIVSEELVEFEFPLGANIYDYTDISLTEAINGSYSFTSINRGDYSASISGVLSVTADTGHSYSEFVSSSNYAISSSGVNNFSISRRVISLDFSYFIDNGIDTEGGWIYDGQYHGVTIKAGNILETDAVTIGLAYSSGGSNTPSKTLGNIYTEGDLTLQYISYDFLSIDYKSTPYSVYIDDVTNNSLSNYRLSSSGREGEWSIDKRQLVVSWDYDTTNSSPIGGGWVYDKLAHGVVMTISNLVSGDTPTFTVNTTGTVPAYGNSAFVPTSSGSGTYEDSLTFTAINAQSEDYIASLMG